jgi:K+/H+ antiporter YhaU regulatory subunit KhtT
MSSEYGVSPETIRRAFSLLEEAQVVKVQPNSGVSVVSKGNAQLYIERHGNRDITRDLQNRMRSLIDENERLGRLLNTTMRELIDATERFKASNPFHTYECTIQEHSILVDNTLGATNFWHQTKATVIAIRRESGIILSPGPSLVLQPFDVLVLVGGVNTRADVLKLTN